MENGKIFRRMGHFNFVKCIKCKLKILSALRHHLISLITKIEREKGRARRKGGRGRGGGKRRREREVGEGERGRKGRLR